MKTIYFIRHGESIANAGGMTMPNAQIPLTEKGHGQAKLLAENWEVDTPLILCSEFLRAQQTAGYLADKLQLSIETEPLLNEFNTLCHSIITGLTGEQRKPIIDKYWLDANTQIAMGESAESFFQFGGRVQEFHNYYLHDIPDKTVIFGHGMWFAMMSWIILGFHSYTPTAMQAFRRYQIGLPMPNCFSYQIHLAADDVRRPLSIVANRHLFPHESTAKRVKNSINQKGQSND